MFKSGGQATDDVIEEALEKGWKPKRGEGPVPPHGSNLSQRGFVDPHKIDDYKKKMLDGSWDWERMKREGTSYGARTPGGYMFDEGHKRMNAALEIAEKTGDTSYARKMIENSRWNNRPYRPGPMPRRSTEGSIWSLIKRGVRNLLKR